MNLFEKLRFPFMMAPDAEGAGGGDQAGKDDAAAGGDKGGSTDADKAAADAASAAAGKGSEGGSADGDKKAADGKAEQARTPQTDTNGERLNQVAAQQ